MDNCMMWPGAKDKDGYGMVKIGGKMRRAHRVALEKKLGRHMEAGECALHSCDHPGCVNPAHLSLGSVAINNKQSRSRRCTLSKTVLGINGDEYAQLGLPMVKQGKKK